MSRETQKICPRCGEPYRWIYRENIHGRSYLYAVHEYIDENGRKRRRKCYLGPEGNYEYVSATHDLEFYGLTKEDRYIRYLEEIIDLFDVDEPVPTDPEEFKKEFENIMRTRSLVNKISYKIDERLRKILETIISDIKTSIDLLKKDYPDNPQAQEILKELSKFDDELERSNLIKSFRILKEDVLRTYIERYLLLKNRLKIYNL
jgi:hypothetical protein